MKNFIIMCSLLIVSTLSFGAEPISLKKITDGEYAAKRIYGVNPLKGSSEYAQISQDQKRIETFSFKTGKQTGTLFDINNTKGCKIDGFDSYQISDNSEKIIIETNTERIYRRSYTAECYIYNIKTKELKALSNNGAQQIATFSPDGNKVAFVRANNIFVTDGNTETQITTDGVFNKIINGIPDWVNEEEFGFNNAIAWSADSKTISWIKYDESAVKTYSLQLFEGTHPKKEEFSDYPGAYSYKYPKAGQDNAKVSAWTYNLETKQTQQYQLSQYEDGYIPRILPTTDPNRIVIYTMNRLQDHLTIWAADPYKASTTKLIEEIGNKYIQADAMSNITFLKDHILIPSDRDGYMHLYLYNKDGKLLKQIEKGSYDVTAVYGYDEKSGNTYFQADIKSPSQREVYVAKSNGMVTNLTPQEGWNSATFSGDYKYFLHNWSDANHPYLYTICDQQGKKVREMLNNEDLQNKLAPFKLTEKEFFSFTTSEGIKLNGWMVKPSDFDPNKKYPVILYQYSGPGSQQVIDSWNIGSMGNGAMFDYYLGQHGYIVACIDGRGTGGRGADFEKCTYLKLGELEAKDQVEAALWLGQQSYVDSTRIGIWGWSFGGFCTLMSMSEGRDAFKAGVAVAPPTNWKYYDTVYTERYMRTPTENSMGYAINPINRAESLHGALLLCHGMADDNVHPQNTFEYAEALVQADKDFKEIYYTNRNHSIYGGNTRNHLLRQISQWFFDNL